MAEGLLRHHGADSYEVFSGGVEPKPVNPLAVEAMKETGIDISGQRSKSVQEFQGKYFDYVITLCGEAQETCPAFPGKYERIHWGLDDPSKAQGSREEKLTAFRIVRNQIKENILLFLNVPRDKARLRCPYCGFIQTVTIPTTTCLHMYECVNCKKILTPTQGSCCVICAYSDKNCPVFGERI